VYNINQSGIVSIRPHFDMPSCGVTGYLYVWDDENYVWDNETTRTGKYPWISGSFSIGTATLDVMTTNYAEVGEYRIKIKVDSRGSPVDTFEDEFNLELKNKCVSN